MKTLKNVLEKIQFKTEGCSSMDISLLVVSRTGKGKSTFINSIIELGKEIAKESPDDICTANVQSYMCQNVISGVNVTLIDTPGLQDTRGLEHKYLQCIKKQCPEVSLVLYCIDMNARRPENDALVAMKKLHQSFGLKFWKRVVFIFTFANRVDCEEIDTSALGIEGPQDDGDDKSWEKRVFLAWLQNRGNKIKSTLKNVLDVNDHKLVDEIPVIPVGYYKKKRNPLKLPCTDNWLFDVLKLCCVQIIVKHKYSKLTLNDSKSYLLL